MSTEREEYSGISNGVNNVKAGVLDFFDFWEGDKGDRAPGYIRVRALKSEAFL
jgi:hypothetical protein